MYISISPEAEEYIQQNGGTISIMLGVMRGCCGGEAPVPRIILDSPRELSSYERKTVKNIIVYTDKKLNESTKVHISLSKLLWLKKLSADLASESP